MKTKRNIYSKKLTFGVILFAASFLCGPLVPVTATAVTFADGLTHVIDASNSFPLEGVTVNDAPGPITTTVNVVAGGEIGTINPSELTALGSSQVNISGGIINNRLFATDTSSVDFSDGSITEFLRAEGSALITISGGEVNRDLEAFGSSTVNISGGIIQNFLDTAFTSTVTITGGVIKVLQARQTSEINILGGVFGQAYGSTGNAVVNISGGLIDRVGSGITGGESTSTVNIFGGTITESVTGEKNSFVNIYGGNIGQILFAVDSAMISIFGSGFNFPLGPLSDLSGTLVGELADGTAINIDFARASTANITLAAVTDTDNDGVADGLDNCIDIANSDQTDTDSNRVGDACNDGEDQDGDEYADNLDNCPNDFNPDNTDIDFDLIGDVCDPFPDNPNNALAQCEEDLTECLDNSIFADADADGEADFTDHCPGTPPDTEVDSEGCSLWQFCSSIDTSMDHGRQICNRSDWKNDEPLQNKGDCEAIKEGQGPSNYLCVPR